MFKSFIMKWGVDWVFSRSKAFIGAASVAVLTTLIKTFETTYGVDVPATWEAAILAAVAGLLIERVPNKVV